MSAPNGCPRGGREPNVRPATETDLDTVVAFMDEHYTYDGHDFDEGAARRAVRDLLRDPAWGRVWLISDDRVAVGYVVLTFGYSLEHHGRDAFIDELFIRPSHRGRGWGRAAVAHVERAAGACGVRALHLEVVRANAGGRRFWQRLGYADRDRRLLTKRIGGAS